MPLVPLETLDHSSLDVTSPVILLVIGRAIESKRLKAANIAFPCSSFSSANHPALRDAEHVAGLPNLT